MAEPGIYRDSYLDDPADFPEKLPSGVERSKDYYAHEVVYENGSRVITWYKRGGPNQPEQQIGVDRDTVPKLKEAWDAKVAKETPSATSQASAGRDTVNVDGRVKQWNPETKRFDIDVGAAGTGAAATSERASQQSVERKRNSEKYGIPFDDIELQEWTDARRKESQAITVQEKQLALQERNALEDSAHKRWQQGITERQLAGTEAERAQNNQIQERQVSLAESKAKREKLEDGTIIEQQADGTWKPIQVEGQPKPGQGPSLDDLQLEFGNITGGYKAYAAKLQEALAQGLITPAEEKQRRESAVAAANLKITEINNLIATQKSYYGEQSANWRQEQATANTRFSAASNAHTSGMTAMNNLKGASGEGAWGQVFGSMAAARMGGEMFGGYASGPPPALPPSAAAIMQMMPDGTITINPKAMGGGGASAAMPASVAPVAASAEEAMQADIAAAGGKGTTLPGQPGPDFAPAPGMNFSGGQLRAPGVMAGAPPSAALMAVPEDIRNEFDEDVLLEAMGAL